MVGLNTAKEKCDQDPMLRKSIMIRKEIQLKRVISAFVQFQIGIYFICFLNDPIQIRTQLIDINDINIIVIRMGQDVLTAAHIHIEVADNFI